MELNRQDREKKVVVTDLLQIHSTWRTIQGEGPLVGSPAVFVRLAGCNYQCPLCDTEYTKNRLFLSVPDSVEHVQQCYPSGLVVITGGEPFRQPIGPFIRGLLKVGYQVQVETNGTLFQPDCPYGSFMIVCSPKAPSINGRLKPHITALKYVVEAEYTDPKDGLPTRVLGMDIKAAKPDGFLASDIYVQPADEQDPEQNKRNLETAMASCFKFGYRLCLQTHKIIGVP